MKSKMERKRHCPPPMFLIIDICAGVSVAFGRDAFFVLNRLTALKASGWFSRGCGSPETGSRKC